MKVHNVLKVLLLNKHVSDPNHIIDCTVIQVENEGYFQVESVHILHWKVKVIRKKEKGVVKIQWNCYSHEYAISQNEENMQEKYPQSFVNFEEDGI
jgi:hypothetical protein